MLPISWLTFAKRVTFGCAAGKLYNLTLPKSSPDARMVLSLLRAAELTSVPSACSGHIPTVLNDNVQVCDAHLTSRSEDAEVICRHVLAFPGRRK